MTSPAAPSEKLLETLQDLLAVLSNAALTDSEYESMKQMIVKQLGGEDVPEDSRPGTPPDKRPTFDTVGPAGFQTIQSSEIEEHDWETIENAVPGLKRMLEARHAEDCIEVLFVEEGGILPPRGMHIVLEGHVSLFLGGQEVAAANPTHCFLEEALVSDSLEVKRGRDATAHADAGSRIALLPRAKFLSLPPELRHEVAPLLLGDLLSTRIHSLQQPLNGCNITALALALDTLDYPTDTNRIFRICNLPAGYLVNEGVTLSELYDIVCAYLFSEGLSEHVSVHAYHLDEGLATEEDFRRALGEVFDGETTDRVLLANFSVATAHGDPDLHGGHFALIAGYNRETELLHMTDVNPEKYGKLWTTTVSRLFSAMTERDETSTRSRGLLQLAAKSAFGIQPQSLERLHRALNMTQFLTAKSGNYSHLFRRSPKNLGALSALSLSLRFLTRANVFPDDLIRAADIPYSDAISMVPNAHELGEIAQRFLLQESMEGVVCRVDSFADHDTAPESIEDKETPEPIAWLESRLSDLRFGGNAVFVINLDVNVVLGCAAISVPSSPFHYTSVLDEFWCVCIHHDPDTRKVFLANIHPATTHVWAAPVEAVCRGIRDSHSPSVVVLQKDERAGSRIEEIASESVLTLFRSDEDENSSMIENVISNIGVEDCKRVDLTGHGSASAELRHQLAVHTGRSSPPYLYFKGKDLGEPRDILELVRVGDLQRRLSHAGAHVLSRAETPSLDHNIYGYPKGGLSGRNSKEKHILLCASGSSAADKIPQLVELLVDEGYKVKLVPSKRAEHFYKDFGMDQILSKIQPHDIYRDGDEWSFSYSEFGMPARAAHLALCSWADCMLVAPATCNTIAKVSHGVGDNLLTSLFNAWEYDKKPVVVCPACNTDMWNNAATQESIERLRQRGVRIEGPRSGPLSNGRVGIGMMALPDEIVNTLHELVGSQENSLRAFEWASAAAESGDFAKWKQVLTALDEETVEIGAREGASGDTLLHFASGGEGRLLDHHIERGKPSVEAARELLKRGADIDAVNNFGFTSLHVAISNDSLEMVSFLLERGADASACLNVLDQGAIQTSIRTALSKWAESRGSER